MDCHSPYSSLSSSSSTISIASTSSTTSTASTPYSSTTSLDPSPNTSSCSLPSDTEFLSSTIVHSSPVACATPISGAPKPAKRVPRPPNAFFLYRRDEVAKYPNSIAADLSRFLGDKWTTETPECKAHYAQLAREVERLHLLQHPDYKFTPKKRGTGKKAMATAARVAKKVTSDLVHRHGPHASPPILDRRSREPRRHSSFLPPSTLSIGHPYITVKNSSHAAAIHDPRQPEQSFGSSKVGQECLAQRPSSHFLDEALLFSPCSYHPKTSYTLTTQGMVTLPRQLPHCLPEAKASSALPAAPMSSLFFFDQSGAMLWPWSLSTMPCDGASTAGPPFALNTDNSEHVQDHVGSFIKENSAFVPHAQSQDHHFPRIFYRQQPTASITSTMDFNHPVEPLPRNHHASSHLYKQPHPLEQAATGLQMLSPSALDMTPVEKTSLQFLLDMDFPAMPTTSNPNLISNGATDSCHPGYGAFILPSLASSLSSSSSALLCPNPFSSPSSQAQQEISLLKIESPFMMPMMMDQNKNISPALSSCSSFSSNMSFSLAPDLHPSFANGGLCRERLVANENNNLQSW